MEASLRRLRTDHTQNIREDLKRLMRTQKFAKEFSVIENLGFALAGDLTLKLVSIHSGAPKVATKPSN